MARNMNQMQPYREFRPTSFGRKGAFLDDEDRGDWLVSPCSVTRDSGPLAQSNFNVLSRELKRLDPDGNDHEAHRFGHWGPGWFEIILCRPESACGNAAEETADALSNYLVLDEMDWSSLEWEAANQAWSSESLEMRLDSIREHMSPDGSACRYCGFNTEPVSAFAIRHDELPAALLEHYRPEE